MVPMSTLPSSRNNVRNRDGTRPRPAAAYNNSNSNLKKSSSPARITGSSTSTYRDDDNGCDGDGDGDNSDDNNNDNNDYDYTAANRNNTAAVPAGLRRRKNATARRNATERDDDDDDNDDDNDHDHTAEKKYDQSLGRFSPSFYPFVHVNEIPSSTENNNDDDDDDNDGFFSTPPRTPSPKPTKKINARRRKNKVLASLSPGDVEEEDEESTSFYGDDNDNDDHDHDDYDQQEIDYNNEFHREKPNKLKNPFSYQNNNNNKAPTLGGTESTANLNSSRTDLNVDFYNDDDECSINITDNKLVRFDEGSSSNNNDEEEGYKNNNKHKHNNSYSTHGDNNDDTDTDNESTALVVNTTAKTAFAKFQHSRHYIGGLVNNEFVQLAIILLIVINAIMMGLATMDWVTDNPDVDKIFTRLDKGFLIIFTIEISMQLYYFGIALFQDGWLVFDLVIVTISWAFESLQVVRAFRIFRAFRLVTRVKPLRDLILAIGQVLPRMGAISLLLIIIFYVFAVLFTELFSDLELSENYFTTLDASLFTCMQMMTLEWGDVTREVMEKGEFWAWIPFVIYIAIAGFIVFNLIVAVVVEAVAATEETVRALEGIESDNPQDKLHEAEERIDLLQHHLDNMMIEQEHIQAMLESMAGEFLNLASERMKAEHRETRLRDEINRRIEYQKNVESKQKEQFQQQQQQNQQQQQQQEPPASLTDREQKEVERKEKVEEMYQSLSSSVSLYGQSSRGDDSARTHRTRRKKPIAVSDRAQNWAAVKPAMARDNSGKSFGSCSTKNSIGVKSCPDAFLRTPPDAMTQSAPTNRNKLDLNARYSTTATSSSSAAQGQNGKRASWKAMLAIKQL
jgi:hypothetical protein